MLPLIASYFPNWNNSLFFSCMITGFCVTSSLALHKWEQKYCQTLGYKPNPSIPIIFDRLSFKFLKIVRLLGKIKKYRKSTIYKFLFLKIIPALNNMFIAFNFFVPALLGIAFLYQLQGFRDRKSGIKYPASRDFFLARFLPCKSRSRGRHSRRLACLLRIQVERLMTSVIAFVITVNWLRCEANCHTLLGGGW